MANSPAEETKGKIFSSALFQRLGIRYWLYLWAAFLMLLSAVFEGAIMGLLIFLIKYLTTGDTASIWNTPILKQIK